ncbi:PBSX family phage terminase large subunit [Salipiger thiooxidans]|uniref:PBSX family phage terminase large subunit n=1 Tax=Salipiger thiooxidans TaxID=282683 RepID=UPI001CD5FE7A|nr:PBSX family phage terminase large subunit [Salipiger thiooxidans]MCA0846111.1 PBSX family phage terminase large subunit [Salipiger thiooxidans]
MASSEPEVLFPRYFRDYFAPARYKGLYGGRGSGKSHCFAGLAVLRCAERPSFRLVCVREVQRSIADSVKMLIEDKINSFGLAEFFKITEAEITGLNGSRIIFRGMQNHTAASIKSLEGFDAAWIEEAQTISRKSLELLTPTIRKEGSEIWASWNPENPDDPIDEELRKHPPDGAIVKLVNWDDNPWFPEELRSDMERDKKRDPDKYAHVWEGQYRALSEARVFRNWRVDEMSPPDNVVWFYGADWGFAQDETAALRCCIPNAQTLYIDAEVYQLGVPTDALPGLLNGLPEARRWPMRGDNARPETIDYLRRHGFPKLRAAKKGKGSIEDGVTFLQGMDIVIHPGCVNLIREMRSYAYKTDPRTEEILPVIEDKNNHAIDALRYAVEGLHRRGKLLKPSEREDANQRRRDYGYSEDEDEGETWKIA